MRYQAKHRTPKPSCPILCLSCTLIYPSPNQRRPLEGERCEVCGQEGRG